MHSIPDLAAAVRGRRTALRMNQGQLAQRAGVSRKWVYEFEAGKPTAELGLLMRVLEALGLDLELVRGEHGGEAEGGGAVDLDALLDGYRD